MAAAQAALAMTAAQLGLRRCLAFLRRITQAPACAPAPGPRPRRGPAHERHGHPGPSRARFRLIT